VRLAAGGANVIAADLCGRIASVPYPLATADDLAATVKLVEDTGARIVAKQGDVRDRDSLTGVYHDQGRDTAHGQARRRRVDRADQFGRRTRRGG
jgi:NAD(P)-dependent dehydrogenase (short-subunit alcohol dehydrogenase family)